MGHAAVSKLHVDPQVVERANLAGGVLVDWTFLDGTEHLPPEAEAAARRPAAACA
jgi:hypothetical protein